MRKILWAALLLLLALFSFPAMAANQTFVVSSCGATLSYPAGGIGHNIAMLPNGVLCATTGNGSGSTTTTQAGTTIAVTNTFQAALASSASRRGCLIQNTSVRVQYIFFGAIGSATLAKSIQLAAGQTISCSSPGGLILTDDVNITGTSGDTYVVLNQ